MIIEIVDEVFGAHANALELYQLFRLALEERHLLLTRPLWPDPHALALEAWLERQPERLRGLLELILEQSVSASATGPQPAHQRTVRVVVGAAPRWDLSPPQLPLAAACRLAEAPLKVLVENRRNDAAFLRACAPPSLRERIEQAEANNWMEFVQGGGLPEMVPRVRADGQRGREHRAARLAVIYDSDAKANYDPDTDESNHDRGQQKWGPSNKAKEMRESCERAAGKPFAHRLRRRAIENYIPGRVLQAWAGSNRDRRTRMSAFLAMEQEQRHYFNMKNGLSGDRKSGISPIYDDLPPAARTTLEEGFDSIADYFHEKKFRIDPQWMRDGQLDEIGPLVETIIGMV